LYTGGIQWIQKESRNGIDISVKNISGDIKEFQILRQEDESMKKIGIVGCGGMGTTHLLSIKALAAEYDIAVTAIADLQDSRLERAAGIWPGAAKYKEGMELLEKEEIDIILICLPSDLHTRFAVAAMERHINVFLEKPVCLTEEDCDKLLKVQKRTGARVLVGQVVRVTDEYRYLKELTDNGTYGRLRSLTLWRLGGIVDWGYQNWFRSLERSGSVVLDLHIHDVDFLRYLLGEPDRVYVNARKNEEGMPEQIITQYRFGETIASAEAVWDNPKGFPFEAGYRACFEHATVVFGSNAENKLTEYSGNNGRRVPVLERGYRETNRAAGINISEIGPYYTEMKYFLDCILNEKEIEILPLSEGVASVRLCLKELRMALKDELK
jgi:predicted dehydrogenase